MTDDLKPAPKMDPNCQCICHRMPGFMHMVACCSAPNDLKARGARDWITQDELARLFPHGLPTAAVKLLFPEKSEPLNTAEVYAFLLALSGQSALSDHPTVKALVADAEARGMERAAKACDRRAGNASDFDRYTRRAAGMCAADIRAEAAAIRKGETT